MTEPTSLAEHRKKLAKPIHEYTVTITRYTEDGEPNLDFSGIGYEHTLDVQRICGDLQQGAIMLARKRRSEGHDDDLPVASMTINGKGLIRTVIDTVVFRGRPERQQWLRARGPDIAAAVVSNAGQITGQAADDGADS